jgi:hypothetical protein
VLLNISGHCICLCYTTELVLCGHCGQVLFNGSPCASPAESRGILSASTASRSGSILTVSIPASVQVFRAHVRIGPPNAILSHLRSSWYHATTRSATAPYSFAVMGYSGWQDAQLGITQCGMLSPKPYSASLYIGRDPCGHMRLAMTSSGSFIQIKAHYGPSFYMYLASRWTLRLALLGF